MNIDRQVTVGIKLMVLIFFPPTIICDSGRILPCEVAIHNPRRRMHIVLTCEWRYPLIGPDQEKIQSPMRPAYRAEKFNSLKEIGKIDLSHEEWDFFHYLTPLITWPDNCVILNIIIPYYSNQCIECLHPMGMRIALTTCCSGLTYVRGWFHLSLSFTSRRGTYYKW